MNKLLNRENFYRLILVMVGLIVAVILAEFGLRAYFALQGKSGKYYVYPPHTNRIFKPKPGVMPGVTGTARFRINSEGIRGDELSTDYQYRILAIGGSTTACLYLDQEKSWPYALQNKLNQGGLLRVWVGNAGKAGLSSREHFMHMKYLLSQYPHLDTIVILVGINDLLRRLIEDNRYDSRFLDHYDYWKQRLIKGAFADTPYYEGKYRFRTGYYDETALGSLYVKFKDQYAKRELIQDEVGDMVVNLRSLRKNANVMVDTLPDLTSALEEYVNNLHAIIDQAKARSIRIIFMTQPSILKAEMTSEEKDLICAGWIESLKSGRYYSEKALKEGLDQYNEALRKICHLRNRECIDLANMLPKDTSVFYDEVHLNDKGSLMVADIISRYLSRRAPFATAEKRR